MWNHRVLHDEDNNAWMIVEVYYDKDEKPHSWCHVDVSAESPTELRWLLSMMKDALSKPAVKTSDFEPATV